MINVLLRIFLSMGFYRRSNLRLPLRSFKDVKDDFLHCVYHKAFVIVEEIKNRDFQNRLFYSLYPHIWWGWFDRLEHRLIQKNNFNLPFL